MNTLGLGLELTPVAHGDGGPAWRIREAIASLPRDLPLFWGPDLGVSMGPLSGTWMADRRPGHPVGVSPLGAALLALQPEPLEVDEGTTVFEDPSGALARALEVSVAWVEGYGDGFQADPSAYWLGHADGADYRRGLEAGYEARHLISHECRECGTRLLPPQGAKCDGCTTERSR